MHTITMSVEHKNGHVGNAQHQIVTRCEDNEVEEYVRAFHSFLLAAGFGGASVKRAGEMLVSNG